MMAATATKEVAAQAPCNNSELKPMEMPNMADAARKMKMKSGYCKSLVTDERSMLRLTDGETSVGNLLPNATSNDMARIIDTVDLAMKKLEETDHPAGLSGHSSDNTEDEDTLNDAECLQGRSDAEHT